jgi:hypothetical protein
MPRPPSDNDPKDCEAEFAAITKNLVEASARLKASFRVPPPPPARRALITDFPDLDPPRPDDRPDVKSKAEPMARDVWPSCPPLPPLPPLPPSPRIRPLPPLSPRRREFGSGRERLQETARTWRTPSRRRPVKR